MAWLGVCRCVFTGSCAVSEPVPYTASPRHLSIRDLGGCGSCARAGGFASAGWLAGGGDQGVLPCCQQMAAGSVTPCGDSRAAGQCCETKRSIGALFLWDEDVIAMRTAVYCLVPSAETQGPGGPGADVPACMAAVPRREVTSCVSFAPKKFQKFVQALQSTLELRIILGCISCQPTVFRSSHSTSCCPWLSALCGFHRVFRGFRI